MTAGLTKAARDIISSSVEKLFAKATARLLGKLPNKTILISTNKFDEKKGLGHLFDLASKEEGFKPNKKLKSSLLAVAAGYMNSQKEMAKAKVINKVQTFLIEANDNNVSTDINTVLGGELADLFGEITSKVNTIAGHETTKARNLGTLDSISKVNAASKIEDPTVFFFVVNDETTCKECRRLHFSSDGVTPKTYKLSEVGHSYHKRGDINPKVGGLHPHCRCTLGTLLPGFGFVGGKVQYIGPEHDEHKHQSST